MTTAQTDRDRSLLQIMGLWREGEGAREALSEQREREEWGLCWYLSCSVLWIINVPCYQNVTLSDPSTGFDTDDHTGLGCQDPNMICGVPQTSRSRRQSKAQTPLQPPESSSDCQTEILRCYQARRGRP